MKSAEFASVGRAESVVRYSDYSDRSRQGQPPHRPLVSLVVPAYNEASIIEQHLAALCEHMQTLEHTYRWEIVVINDGSSDATGALAEAFARGRDNVQVLHHAANKGLGRAFQF